MSPEGTNMEKPNRNDPVSALAIRAIVAKGYCTQEQANECFSLACDALEAEAARMNEELPWVTRIPAPAVERGVAEIDYEEAIAYAFEKHGWRQGTTGCIAFSRGAQWMRDKVLTALSTAGKEQA